jgi:octaprenyl-diphosphate synthase
MRTGSSKQASIIREAIKSGGESGFQTVLEIIQETGALDYAKQRAQKEAEIATEAIAKLADSSYKECLLQLAYFAVTRNH